MSLVRLHVTHTHTRLPWNYNTGCQCVPAGARGSAAGATPTLRPLGPAGRACSAAGLVAAFSAMSFTSRSSSCTMHLLYQPFSHKRVGDERGQRMHARPHDMNAWRGRSDNLGSRYTACRPWLPRLSCAL
jgi:hypothetical protein